MHETDPGGRRSTEAAARTFDIPPPEPFAGPWRAYPIDRLVATVMGATGRPEGRPAIVAIDGRQGSGKSTLASRLQDRVDGAVIVASDDVAWWEAILDWDRLMAGGILRPLHDGAAVSFRPPAWDARGRPGAINVAADTKVVLLEGVGVSRRSLAPFIDVSLWMQADAATARRRGLERDGGPNADVELWDRWQAEERPFFAADRPWERAMAVICGTPELAGIPHDPTRDLLVGRSLRT